LERKEKDADLAETIRVQQERCFKTYGYRRMWLWLEKQGTHRNPKTILRIMKKYGLLAEIRRRRKWMQMGQQLHKYENLLDRQFQSDRPNSKWVTDISYIHTKEGVLYLSMIRDLYDNSIVAYKTGTQQTVNLVLDIIRLAMKSEKKKVAAELQLHSDQGFQYTWHAYFTLTQKYEITPSMSRRGNCYDNAMAENFFSILKTECIYRLKPKTMVEAREAIDAYIHFLQPRANPVKNWSGTAFAAPLRLKLNISYQEAFFVLSAQSGAVHGAAGSFSNAENGRGCARFLQMKEVVLRDDFLVGVAADIDFIRIGALCKRQGFFLQLLDGIDLMLQICHEPFCHGVNPAGEAAEAYIHHFKAVPFVFAEPDSGERLLK
jgi:putative transposase